MKDIWAVPVIASILILGAIAVLSPTQIANAGGPVCPPGDVTISLQHSKLARATFDTSISSVSFFESKENCTPDNGPPEFTARANIQVAGCGDVIDLDSNDFNFGFGHTTLTLDNTNCGDIFVEWRGNGKTQDSSNNSDVGDNCNDGKNSFRSHSKFRLATATLWVDGVEFDTTVDENDALLEKRTVIFKKC